MAKTKAENVEVQKVNDSETVMVALTDLTPYWNNPRDNEEAVPAVMESIREFGFSVPIVVDKDNEIIAGHTRYKAAQRLGLEWVPVIIKHTWTPEMIRRFRMAENKTGEIAGWDFDRLVQELRAVEEPATMQPYFVGMDLDSLLAETSGSGGYQAPEQDKINERGRELERTFADRSDVTQSGYVDVTCPECGEDFSVQRDDIVTRSDPGSDFQPLEVVIPTEMEDVFAAAEEKVKRNLADQGVKPHSNPGVWRGQILEVLIAEYLAGPD